MALFEDKQRGTLSRDLLLAHVAHLKCCRARGQLVLCGPFKDDDGAIQVIAAASMDEARRIVESDPVIARSYYRRWRLLELIEANEDNNWLVADPQTAANVPGS